MSAELVPLGDFELRQIDGLQRLIEVAQSTDEPHAAHEIMEKARACRDLFRNFRSTREQARLAAVAWVCAGRKLGRALSELSGQGGSAGRGKVGTGFFSPRRQLAESLGLTPQKTAALVTLARIDDPIFQRYIQDESLLPSIDGLLRLAHARPSDRRARIGWRSARRKRIGVKTPKNPSIDRAYSEIRIALGHLSAVAGGGGGNSNRGRDLSRAIDLLYEVTDLVGPYLAGYGDDELAA